MRRHAFVQSVSVEHQAVVKASGDDVHLKEKAGRVNRLLCDFVLNSMLLCVCGADGGSFIKAAAGLKHFVTHNPL